MPRKPNEKRILLPAIPDSGGFWGDLLPRVRDVLSGVNQLAPDRKKIAKGNKKDPLAVRDAPALFAELELFIEDYRQIEAEDQSIMAGRRVRPSRARVRQFEQLQDALVVSGELPDGLTRELKRGREPAIILPISSWNVFAVYAALSLERAAGAMRGGRRRSALAALAEAERAIGHARDLSAGRHPGYPATADGDDAHRSRPDAHRERARNTTRYAWARAELENLIVEHRRRWQARVAECEKNPALRKPKEVGLGQFAARLHDGLEKAARAAGEPTPEVPTERDIRSKIRETHEAHSIPGINFKGRRPRIK